jgi:hypothetical protein
MAGYVFPKPLPPSTVPSRLPQISPVEFGGSPLLQQGELDFSPVEKRFFFSGMGFSPGVSRPALKRMIKVELSPRNAKALLPSAEAEGSHQNP